MTPTQHLAEADRLLAEIGRDDSPWPPDWVLSRALQAQAHAMIAVADALGIAHAPGPAGSAGNENS